jgi:hypothetical protein
LNKIGAIAQIEFAEDRLGVDADSGKGAIHLARNGFASIGGGSEEMEEFFLARGEDAIGCTE